jgi:hypothetical protein
MLPESPLRAPRARNRDLETPQGCTWFSRFADAPLTLLPATYRGALQHRAVFCEQPTARACGVKSQDVV